jgi:hypothetical protein
MQVTDRVLYKTIHWTVETENDTYKIVLIQVIYQEGDWEETWYIDSEENGDIDINSDLGQQIIDVCTDYEVIDADDE